MVAGLPDRIAGRYRVLREIGRGGMALVVEAVDEISGQPCAIKLLNPQVPIAAEVAERFLREVDAGAMLGQHPGIIQVLDAGQLDRPRTLYLVMELVRGTTLDDRVQAGLARPQGIAIVEEIARAIAYAHGKGFIHRDLKPENVLVDDSGHGRLFDFGLVKALADMGGAQLTRAGQVLGTPAYMAPEQILDSHACDERTDIYGLGAILFFVLTRRPPFEGQGRRAILEAVVTGRHSNPRQLDATIDARIEAICLACLQPKPDARPARAADLADAISAWRTAAGSA